MDLIITRATEPDIPLITSILTSATAHKIRHGDSVWGTGDWTDEEVRERMAIGTPYLAYIGGEAVGTVSLQWEDKTNWGAQKGLDGQAGYAHRLATKDGFHGQNLGAKIMDWAATEVAKKGRKYLRLDCPTENKSLCAYYENQGFKKVQDRPVPAHGNYIAALYERRV